MKTNQEFKNEALAALRGNWGKAVVATLLVIIFAAICQGPSSVMSALNQEQMQSLARYGDTAGIMTLYGSMLRVSGAAFLLMVFFYQPLVLGYENAMLGLLYREEREITPNMFHIAFSNYWHKVGGMVWMYILVALWSLLFVIPGLIKAFSYAMTPYILHENPELSITEAIHRSRMMMRGHKFDLFWLYLSFIGWILLAIMTAGIGFLWLTPYMETAQAAFYNEVKADYAVRGGLD